MRCLPAFWKNTIDVDVDETTRARYMLILVRMLMRCLRKRGFDRRLMAEAALAMRDVMSREEEPSFVIKDPRYVKESTNSIMCY